MGDDAPHLIPAGDSCESLVEIPIQWINDDWPHFGFCSIPRLGFGISSTKKVFEVWSEEFAGCHQYDGCYVLTMHPFVIGRPSRVRLLKQLIEFINQFDGVWWAKLGDVAEHLRVAKTAPLREFPDLRITGSP